MSNLVTLCAGCHEIAEDKEALKDFRTFMASGPDLETMRMVAKHLSEYVVGHRLGGQSFEVEDSIDILMQCAREAIHMDAYDEGRQVQFRIDRSKTKV